MALKSSFPCKFSTEGTTLISPFWLTVYHLSMINIIPCYYINRSELQGFLSLKKIVSLDCKKNTRLHVFVLL